MHPQLPRLGPFQLRFYGLALSISFLVGCWLALRRGVRRGMSEDLLLGVFWWLMIGSVIGSRLHFVLAHPEGFPHPVDALKIWEGGMTLYGGLAAAVLASWIYLRRHRAPFLPIADLFAPSIALGEAITRIGCFLNGCCFGQPCSAPFAVHYPAGSYPADVFGAGVGIWPSQLMLSGGSLLLSGLLLWLGKRLLERRGAVFGLFLVLQGLMRWAVDFTRYYEPSDRVTGLGALWQTKSQLVAWALILLGALLLARARPAASATSRAAPGDRR